MIEDEGDARRVEDLRVLHFVFENLHDEVGAEVVHDHEVDVGDDDVAGTTSLLPLALARIFSIMFIGVPAPRS